MLQEIVKHLKNTFFLIYINILSGISFSRGDALSVAPLLPKILEIPHFRKDGGKVNKLLKYDLW